MNSLKILRAASRMTLEDLAEALDVAPSTVSRWENGVTRPGDPTLAERAMRLVEARVPNSKLVAALR